MRAIDRPPARPRPRTVLWIVAILLCAPWAERALAGPQILSGGISSPASEATPGNIVLDPAPGTDTVIAERLAAIYAELRGLDQVEIEVRSGVVHLSGEVLTPELRDQATRLAREIKEVVEVDDRIEVVSDVRRRLKPAFDTLTRAGDELISALPLLGVALLVIAGFWMLSRWAGRWGWLYGKLVSNPFARDWVRRIIQGMLLILGIVLALEILNATALVGAVLGAAGVAGLALGFAFRDTAENYIAGLLLSVRQPFEPNDHILIEGREGKVVRLTPRATILLTFDGNHVRIPNSVVFKGILVNYTRLTNRRFKVLIRVGREADLSTALDTGKATVARLEGVLEDPAPGAWVDELGDTYVVLAFVGWVDQDNTDFYRARSEAMRTVKEALARHGMPMPEPAYRLTLSDGQLRLAGADGLLEGSDEEDAKAFLEEPDSVAQPQPGSDSGRPRDTSRRDHIDRAVDADRAADATTPDLLRRQAPRE